jgi:hypothetical protein
MSRRAANLRAELADAPCAIYPVSMDRPLVAATVYHYADGTWATPLWLIQTLPRYRFLFRPHG